MDHCSGTHRARFNRSKQFTVAKAVVTEVCTGRPQSDNLGVRAGIRVGEITIPAASDDAAVEHHNCADGNLARFQCALGSAKRFFHPEFVGAGRLLVFGH